MSYQSRPGQSNSKTERDSSPATNDSGNDALDAASQKKQERLEASKNVLKNKAIDAGKSLGGPIGSKLANKAINSKTGDKLLNKGAETLNKIPGMGRKMSKLNDAREKEAEATKKAFDPVNKFKNMMQDRKKNLGGEQDSALPSSDSAGSEESKGNSKKVAGVPGLGKPSFLGDKDGEKSNKGGKGKDFKSLLMGNQAVKLVLGLSLPFVFLFLIIFAVVGGVVGIFSDFGDAFGISAVTGADTGGLNYEAASEEQQNFYNRVNDVKLRFQANGRTVDPLAIVGVYHILQSNGAEIVYDDMTDYVISQIAEAMFDGNTYSEEVFKSNLIKHVIPEFIPSSLDAEREAMADEVLSYVSNYHSLIGSNGSGGCASMGNCYYDIKGFSIENKGNFNKPMQIKDLKVRLMECGQPYGSGTYGKPIDQDLVNFEDYVAGVAYAEVGDYADIEVLKAQMVAARSFALARPTAMNNGLGKKLEMENGQWVLQITSCVADQVFCDLNQGCSSMGGGTNGQGGVVRTGHFPGAIRYRPPIPENHPLRTAAVETQGEVLVNAQGYIIFAEFYDTEQKKFAELARQGLNYKQILLQVYNQGKRNYGATAIQKASCNTTGSCSSSPSSYANWKQFEGPWTTVLMGNSGKTIKDIGCLVTSVSMLLAKSGASVSINSALNPGTFVEFLNSHGGIDGGGNYQWNVATQLAPSFKFVDSIDVSYYSKGDKLAKIKELVGQTGIYVVAEVKGDTGQHWVAIDSVNGDKISMMDPGSRSTDMWSEYNWANTSRLAYYRVG